MRGLLCVLALVAGLFLFAGESKACDQFGVQQFGVQQFNQGYAVQQLRVPVYAPQLQLSQGYYRQNLQLEQRYIPQQRQNLRRDVVVLGVNQNNHRQSFREQSQQRRANRAQLRAQQLQQRANHH